jgi:hypothetical protein
VSHLLGPADLEAVLFGQELNLGVSGRLQPLQLSLGFNPRGLGLELSRL